jgi:hypothetical protein
MFRIDLFGLFVFARDEDSLKLVCSHIFGQVTRCTHPEHFSAIASLCMTKRTSSRYPISGSLP